MSAQLREASDAEIEAVWPAARAARQFPDLDAFRAWADRGRWRVRVNDLGDAALLVRWRSHLDLLAIRALWCPPRRVPDLLRELRTFARGIGFTSLVSPLLDAGAIQPYLGAGMHVRERLVTFRAAPSDVVPAAPPADVVLGEAADEDAEGIASVESASFDEFWRHDLDDIRRDLRVGRLVVARRGGQVVGYTLSGVARQRATLGRLAVQPASRRQGVGRALLADVAAGAQRRGATVVTLCTQRDNVSSRGLYAACGFHEVPGELVIATDD